MTPVEVLLTDLHRGGLAVARSLASHGISFLALDGDPYNPAFYSRSVKRALVSPSPSSEPEVFLDFVLDVIRKHQIKLVIPIGDSSLLVFERYRDSIERETKLAMASSRAIRSVLDKRINLEIARRVGVPCPAQFELENPQQIPEMIRGLGFPIVLKRPGLPFDPEVPTFNFRVLYARNEEELRGYIDQHCREGIYPIFQECATGTVHNFCCFAVQGEVVAVHEYYSIRRWEGTAVLREIVEPNGELVAHTRNLLRALKWDGVAHVAFFVSRDRKKTWYMETNGRFWTSTEGSVHAGWDFPYWTYNYFLYGRKPEPGRIHIGSLTCWHAGDLAALLRYLGGGEPPGGGINPGKLLAVMQYLGGFSPAIHSDVFRWSDPMPGIMDHWQLFKRLWRRIRQRGRCG